MKFHIIDEMMGRGKTSAAINFIKSHPNRRYIYITPYLQEVERIEQSCSFLQPVRFTERTPKIVSLKMLLKEGHNIVTTHSLFSYFDTEVIESCRKKGYTLIMDEVHSVVEEYSILPFDLEILMKSCAEVQSNGLLKWTGSGVSEKFAEEKRLCELGCLGVYQNTALLWLFPIKVFDAFKEVYVLTYMFGAQLQKYYYDYHGIKYDRLYVKGDNIDNYEFCSDPQESDKGTGISSLVYILDDNKMNAIGNGKYTLGKQWYKRNGSGEKLAILKNNLINYFTNKKVLYCDGEYTQTSAQHNLWTTFSEYQTALSGKGYTKGFIPLNMRATNEYRDRTVIAYTVNRFINPYIKNFFVSNGISVDEDAFALSEMLQFIWRSGIRDGKHISLYIPSSRMRELFVNWLTYVN